jgi:hypothetical protein
MKSQGIFVVNKPDLFVIHEYGSLVIIIRGSKSDSNKGSKKYTYAILCSNLNFLGNILHSIYIG